MGSLISGAANVGMGIEQGTADEKALQQQLERENQQADMAIRGAQEKGAYESGKARAYGAQLAAKQRVAYANSGVDATKGTAAAVQSDTQGLSELDAQTASINAAREAWGYREAKKQAKEEYVSKSQTASRKAIGAVLGGSGQWVSGGMSAGGGG